MFFFDTSQLIKNGKNSLNFGVYCLEFQFIIIRIYKFD